MVKVEATEEKVWSLCVNVICVQQHSTNHHRRPYEHKKKKRTRPNELDRNHKSEGA